MSENRPTNAEKGLPEPKRRGALVRDRDGDLWKRGNTRWTCQTPVDGVRVLRVGRRSPLGNGRKTYSIGWYDSIPG